MRSDYMYAVAHVTKTFQTYTHTHTHTHIYVTYARQFCVCYRFCALVGKCGAGRAIAVQIIAYSAEQPL